MIASVFLERLTCFHEELCAGKKVMRIPGCSLNVQPVIWISNLSQGLTPLGGMRCKLNISGHLIIATKKLLKIPSL